MQYYKQYTEQLLPPWALTPDKVPYFAVSGSMKDDVNTATQDAIQDSFIQSAPDDALLNLGSNFNIDKAPPFTNAQYKAKLEEHWQYWKTSGTKSRLLTEIKSYGYPNAYIIPEYIEFPSGTFTKTIPVKDPNPAMDNGKDTTGVGWWSNFWVIIDQPHPFTLRKWGTPPAGIWGVGAPPNGIYKWGSLDGDPQQLAALVALIRKLKPAWTSCRGLVFLLIPGGYWGSFNWGDGTLWGLDPSSYSVYPVLEDWEIIRGI